MPIQAAIILMCFCLAGGYGLCLLVQKIHLIHRKEFTAYTDEQLREKRAEMAYHVRGRADNHRNILPEPLRLVVRIDKELARRKDMDEKHIGMIEESDRAKFVREMNQFEAVYGYFLNSVEQKRILEGR